MAPASEAREWAHEALRGIGDSLYTPFSGPDGDDIDWDDSARIVEEIPAVCATKEGAFRPANSRLLHELAPELVIWECDTTVYRAGWLRDGTVGPAQLGTTGYLYVTPQRRILSEYWKLIWDHKLLEAMDYAVESGLDQFGIDIRSWFTCYPGRSDYFTHWGGAFKYAASVLGLPVGDYPHSRPPQAELPEQAQQQIRSAYRRFGLVDR